MSNWFCLEVWPISNGKSLKDIKQQSDRLTVVLWRSFHLQQGGWSKKWQAGLIERPLRGSDCFRQEMTRTWARRKLWNRDEGSDARTVAMEILGLQTRRSGDPHCPQQSVRSHMASTTRTDGHLHYARSSGELGTTFSRLDLPQDFVHDSWVKAQDFRLVGKQTPNPTERRFKEKSKPK